MKLIIDIPEELIESFNNAKKENAFNYFRVYNNTFYNAIRNGIPLEDIKTELNNLDFDFGNYYDETEAILNKINSVLDKHIEENKQ